MPLPGYVEFLQGELSQIHDLTKDQPKVGPDAPKNVVLVMTGCLKILTLLSVGSDGAISKKAPLRKGSRALLFQLTIEILSCEFFD